MARNGSGTYSVPNTFVNGTTADADEVNANYTDMGNEITNSIAADGQTTPTANLPMGGFKLTGMGSGSAAGDSANLGQVQAQAYTWCGTAGGTVDAITLSPSPAITAYVAGQEFRFVASGNNTTATTINVSGLGTKSAQLNGSALAADDIVGAKIYKAIYDGTQFQISRFSKPTETNLLTTANTFTKTQTWTKGSDVASASALTLGDGNYFDITGTTAITSISTKGVGTVIKLHFDGVLTLTHHATDLILPGGANIATAAGDEAEFVEYASGDWRCTNYSKESGEAVTSPTTYPINLGTPVATTSGTAIDFTSIPTGVKRITLNFNNVSTNGTDPYLIQIGTGGSPTTTGYNSTGVSASGTSVGTSNYTTGIAMRAPLTTSTVSGSVQFNLLDASNNIWSASGIVSSQVDNSAFFISGGVSLSGVLDNLRLTTLSGTNTFDNGSVNISWES